MRAAKRMELFQQCKARCQPIAWVTGLSCLGRGVYLIVVGESSRRAACQRFDLDQVTMVQLRYGNHGAGRPILA